VLEERMDIVEQYVAVNDAISQLENRASALREDLLRPGARLQNTQYQVVVHRQKERVLKTELLPPEILNDPRFWDVAEREEVNVMPLADSPVFLRPQSPVQVDLLRYRC
jgi:hypothetical protein